MSKVKVGDRVQNPSGHVGTIKWTGKNPKWSKGWWVGVEYDRANGDCDGRAKDKIRHFKCKKKHGTYQKPSYFTPWKPGGGGKSKKLKKRKGKKGKKKAAAAAAELDDDDDFKAPSAPKSKVQVWDMGIQTDPPQEAYSNQQLARYVLVFEREKCRQLEKENTDLKAKLRESLSDLSEAQAAAKGSGHDNARVKLENAELRGRIEELELTIELLKVQLEDAQLDVADCREKIEEGIQSALMAAISDTDDRAKGEVVTVNARLQEALDQLLRVAEPIMSEKSSEIERLKAQLRAIPLLETRIRDLLPLERLVEELKWDMTQNEQAADELKQSEAAFDDLKMKYATMEGEMFDWQSYVILVDDERSLLEELNEESDHLIEDLTVTTKELKQKLANAQQKMKRKDADLRDLQKQFFEVKNELDEINRAQMEVAFDTTSIGAATAAAAGTEEDADAGDAGDAKSAERGGVSAAFGRTAKGGADVKQLANMNFLLSKQIAEAREVLSAKVYDSVRGKEQYVRNQLYQAYFPESLRIDETGIDCLCHLTRSMAKARQIRVLLEKFYVNPMASASKNAELCLQSHVLSSLLLKVENYLRAIQHAFLKCSVDDWPPLCGKYKKDLVGPLLAGTGSGADGGPATSRKNIEFGLDQLLECFEKSKLSEFDIEILGHVEEVVKEFVKAKVPSTMNPDTMALQQETRANKALVLKSISDAYYRMQSITIHMNRFSSKVYAVMHTDVQTTKKLGTDVVASVLERAQAATLTDGMEAAIAGADDEDVKVMEDPMATASLPMPQLPMVGLSLSRRHSVDEDTIERAVTRLRIGIVEKMFRLRNSITVTCQQILAKTNPVDVGFKAKKRVSPAQMDSANRTSVTVGQLNACLKCTRQALTRVEGIVASVSEIRPKRMLPSERALAINKILDGESEVVEGGLLPTLDQAFISIRAVMKLMDSVGFVTVTTTDELTPLTAEEKAALDEEIHKAVLEATGGKVKDEEKLRAIEFGKGKQVWAVKSAAIRADIDAAYDLQQQMKLRSTELREAHRRMREMQDAIDQKHSTVEVLKQQLCRDESRLQSTVDIQKKFAKMSALYETYVAESSMQSKRIRELESKLTVADTNIDNYKKAIHSMKTDQAKKGSRGGARSRLGARGRAESKLVRAPSFVGDDSSAAGGGVAVGSTLAVGAITAEMIRSGAVSAEALMAMASKVVGVNNPALEMASDPFALMYMSLLQKTITALHRRLNQFKFLANVERTASGRPAVLSLEPLPKEYTADWMAKRKRLAERKKKAKAAQSGGGDEEVCDESKEELKEDALTVEEILAGKTEKDRGDGAHSARDEEAEHSAAIDMESQSAKDLRTLTQKIATLKAIPKVVDITSTDSAQRALDSFFARQMHLRKTQQKVADLQSKVDAIRAQRLAVGAETAEQPLAAKTHFAKLVIPKGVDAPKLVDVVVCDKDLHKLGHFIGV